MEEQKNQLNDKFLNKVRDIQADFLQLDDDQVKIDANIFLISGIIFDLTEELKETNAQLKLLKEEITKTF